MNLQLGQNTMAIAHFCSRWHHWCSLKAGSDSVVGMESFGVSLTTWQLMLAVSWDASGVISQSTYMRAFCVVSYFLHSMVVGFQEQVSQEDQFGMYSLL